MLQPHVSPAIIIPGERTSAPILRPFASRDTAKVIFGVTVDIVDMSIESPFTRVSCRASDGGTWKCSDMVLAMLTGKE
jgi:hypothetical protein